MAAAFAFLTRLRIWSLLLLAAIGLQAAEPIRAPLERLHGSAFSAATADVALASARRVQGQHIADVLPVPHAPSSPDVFAVPRFAVVQPSHRYPEARGPPPRSHPARLPDSTAPPIA